MKQENLSHLIWWSLLIVLYLFVEWIYNQHLLVVLSYDTIKPSSFELTEIFGKLVASIGINLIIKKLFKYEGWPRFFVGLLIGYLLLTGLFKYAIESFSDEFRQASYYSMQYRKDVINQKDEAKILAFTNNTNWYVKPLALSYFFFTLHDDQWKKFENLIEKPAQERMSKLEKNKQKYWKNYQRAESANVKFEEFYSKYQDGQSQYERYMHSKYEKRARNKFTKTFGIAPGFDKERIIAIKFKPYAEYLNSTIFEGNEDLEAKPIYGRDVPHYMTEAVFMDYISEQSNEIKTKIAPNLKQVRQTKSAGDAVAILVVPPISIFLSLTSILLNVILLGYAWVTYFKEKLGKSYYVISAVYFSIAAVLFGNFINNKQSPLNQSAYWTDAEQLQRSQHPMLSYLWNFTLKAEPILCLTEVEPIFVKAYTDKFYQNANQILSVFKPKVDAAAEKRRLDQENKSNFESQKILDSVNKQIRRSVNRASQN